jgi:hypothetical protein
MACSVTEQAATVRPAIRAADAGRVSRAAVMVSSGTVLGGSLRS